MTKKTSAGSANPAGGVHRVVEHPALVITAEIAHPGPREAVEEFLKDNDDFEIDHSREKFMVTFYPSGYLKRVK